MVSTTTGKKIKNNNQQNRESQTAFITLDFGIQMKKKLILISLGLKCILKAFTSDSKFG